MSSKTFFSTLSFQVNLTCFVDEYVARTRLFASRKFREELYDKAIEVKIKSFPDVKTQYELGLVKYTNVFVNGLINYMNSVSMFPYYYYPEGIERVECFSNDNIWEVTITFSGVTERTTELRIQTIPYSQAVTLVKEHLEEVALYNIDRAILKDFIDEDAIKDMEIHMKESDGYNSEDEEIEEDDKFYECENCPVCWEKLESNTILFGKKSFIPKCGHPICFDCKAEVDNKCPTCRANYTITSNYYEEAKEWIENEIDEHIARENCENLASLINIDGLAEFCIRFDGLAHTLGYEYEVDWRGRDESGDAYKFHWIATEY